MAGLTWLHLSDWHQGRESDRHDRQVIRDALIRDIYQRKNISPDLARVDFIIFSGDVAFSGKQEEYQAAIENLFEPVLEFTDLSRDRLFIVPGNHDLDRMAFELLPNSLLKPFESESQVEKWLTNAKRRVRLLEPFAAYKQFVNEYTGQDSPDYASVRRLEINGKRVALLGLNSSLMAGRKNERGEIDEFGNLIVGEPQIYEHLHQIASDDVRIAVLHHPLNWLAEFDRFRIEQSLGRECHFILYGNERNPRVNLVTASRGDYVLIPAGASYNRADVNWAINYNFVHLDFENGRGVVYLRRWSDRRGAWLKDEDAHNKGLYEFDFVVAKTGSEKKQLTPVESEKFDVFLCHNSKDKPEIREIARQLQQLGLKPWLDEWELRPGLSWQELLEEQIEQVKTAAVFVGRSGFGPWQEREMRAFLSEFVNRDCPVIPVLLETAPDMPKLPIFLKGMTWVDFRHRDSDPMARLIWGITGSKPSEAYVESFRQAEGKEYLKRLIRELSASEVEDRIHAVEALGKIKNELVDSDAKVAVSAITAALSDENMRVRQAVANTLGQIGRKAKEVLPTLIQALKDTDVDVRRNAAKALGNIGDEAALPALKEALNDTLIRDVVNTALLNISSVQEQQLQKQYSVWSKQIRQSLYESNSAILAQFPAAHRDFILQEFGKEFDFLDLVFHQDTATLELSEGKRMNDFSEAWRQAEIAMQQHDIEKFRSETDRVTHFLCRALNFEFLDNRTTQGKFYGQFYGQMIDASNPAFSLNIRNEFPVIYACHTEFNEEDVVMGVMSLLHWFKIEANFFALLIVFSNRQEIREQVRESAYKNDLIVLTYNHLWDILAAKAPIQQLMNCILEQIDLVFLSPYTVGGPVPKKMFFGRAEEEKTLLQNIKRKDYALLANRKSGKTSLLNKIYPCLQAIPNYQVFYCDLQAVNDYQTFSLELSLSYPELEEQISKITEFSPFNFSKLALDIKQHYSDKQIIFIFDEVDEILAYDLQENEQLFRVFRSLSQRQNIRFIFSGTTTLVKRTLHPNSPLFNFCNPIKLSLLEEKAARELVIVPMKTLGVKFENESAIIQRILSITAQHPNIIQYICSELIQIVNTKKLERTIEEQDLDQVLNYQKFYDYFETLIWGQSTTLERLIVYAMWSYPEFTESEVIEELKRRKIPSDGVKASLEILLTYSTLSKKNNKYFFTFREFAKLMEKRSDIPALTEQYIEQYQREIGGSEA